MSRSARTRPVACLLAALLATVAAAADAESDSPWTLNAALKQMDKAAKGFRGIRATVHFAEEAGEQPFNGEGTLYVSAEGIVRVDVGDKNVRTYLAMPPYMYIHDPTRKIVEIFSQERDPQILGMYALLGFVPTGTALKKKYQVNLVGEKSLEGREVLFFTLLPKSKKLRAGVARIELWVDPTTWLPAQHRIHHATADVGLSIRYLDVTRDEEIPESVFRPRWPAGTQQVVM